MLLKKMVLIIGCLFSIVSTSFSQNEALSFIDKEDLKRHLTFIASDSLQGRCFGTEANGLEITTNYLAQESKRIGLSPGVENYFQEVKMVWSGLDEARLIQVEGHKSKSLYKPNSFLIEEKKLNKKAKTVAEPVEAKNVIGIVEGSDPQLKNECVVFVAHYDHLGVASNGDVYNGADDNGSGTVTLLEVAEAFMSLEQKPKRSIVFLWVTAEEIGLLGSKYYTENPVFPLEKTVACINIDMDGRVYEPRDSVWKQSPKMVKDFDGLFTLSNNVWPELKEVNNSNCEKLGLVPDNSLPSNFLRSSDHYHFHNNGVPILNYSTGYHADFHKVGDEVSKINFDKMKRVADLCFLVGLEIANREKIEFEEIKDK